MSEYVDAIVIGLNEEENLERCLKSLVGNKSIKNIFYIDSGSQDKSVSIAQKYISNIYKAEKQSIAAQSRNFGAQLATSDYILFLDADMEFEGNCDELIGLLHEHNASGLIGNRDDVYTNDNQSTFVKKNIYAINNTIEANHIGGSLLIKKEDFTKSLGFGSNLPAFEESFLLLSLKKNSNKIIATNAKFIKHYLRSNELSKEHKLKKNLYRIFLYGKLISESVRNNLTREFRRQKKEYVRFLVLVMIACPFFYLHPILIFSILIFDKSPKNSIKNFIATIGLIYFLFNNKSLKKIEFKKC